MRSRLRRTTIEWATHVWNPTTGCSHGCEWCYARRIAHRFHRSFEPQIHPERLDQPLHLRKPARIFVDSAGDLFDPAIPFSFIERVYHIMAFAKHHTFFILTKQPHFAKHFYDCTMDHAFRKGLRNVWLGVSVTNQPDADEQIRLLQETPAAHRFVSVEPILGPIVPERMDGIDWVIIGAQTGPGSIWPKLEWVHSLTAQYVRAGIKVFHKNSLFPPDCEGETWYKRDIP